MDQFENKDMARNKMDTNHNDNGGISDPAAAADKAFLHDQEKARDRLGTQHCDQEVADAIFSNKNQAVTCLGALDGCGKRWKE